MCMTEQEKIEHEKEIRHKILMEQRERKAEWRRNNKESVRRSNQKYYAKNGKGWKAAIKRVQRELIARDKIIVKDAKTVESEYVIFGEHREKGNTQIRGISLSKTLPIDLDALLGKDDENE